MNSTCPKCTAPLTPGVIRCVCGHELNASAPKDAYVSEDLIAKAEALYESHLVARVIHARRLVKDIKIAVLRSPRDQAKVAALKHAEETTRGLQAQLVAQSRKTAEAHMAAQEARARLGMTSAPAQPTATPAPSAAPSESFRALQVTRAESITPVDPEPICGACGRRSPASATRCACGYTFHPHGAELPRVQLSEDEMATLRALNLVTGKSDSK